MGRKRKDHSSNRENKDHKLLKRLKRLERKLLAGDRYSRGPSQRSDPPDQNTLKPPDSAQENNLDPSVLEIIGARLDPERTFTAAIHEDLAIRIEEIIRKGLPTEERKSLMNKFPLPSNCIVLDPPKLNLEVKAFLQDAVIKRDVRISEKQWIITAALAATINLMIKVLHLDITERLEILESLNGAIRLLSDLQHNESVVRRSLIQKNLDTSVRDMLMSTVADEWLFSKDLEDKVKAVKTLASSMLYWPAQPWFPVFMALLQDDPIFFKPSINVLTSLDRQSHPVWEKITLVAGILSGQRSKGSMFRKRHWIS
ncbi:hypothetical protein DMN91_008378 [Ooceraea biroi]|uniref:Uncharacterized protein n=1 Tax=Ooceraea biroi TaxID=2015173 RepID=A0A3L8DIR0_OOCBI|nr:hypothetical protein DMN91_008378 [Ooceraea biroi]